MNKPIKTLLPVYYSCSEAPSGGCGEPRVPTVINLTHTTAYSAVGPYKDAEEFGYKASRPRKLATLNLIEGSDGFEMDKDVKMEWKDDGTIHRNIDEEYVNVHYAYKCCYDFPDEGPEHYTSYCQYYGYIDEEETGLSYEGIDYDFKLEKKRGKWGIYLEFDEDAADGFECEYDQEEEDYVEECWLYLCCNLSGSITFTDKNGISVTASDVHIRHRIRLRGRDECRFYTSW